MREGVGCLHPRAWGNWDRHLRSKRHEKAEGFEWPRISDTVKNAEGSKDVTYVQFWRYIEGIGQMVWQKSPKPLEGVRFSHPLLNRRVIGGFLLFISNSLEFYCLECIFFQELQFCNISQQNWSIFQRKCCKSDRGNSDIFSKSQKRYSIEKLKLLDGYGMQYNQSIKIKGDNIWSTKELMLLK